MRTFECMCVCVCVCVCVRESVCVYFSLCVPTSRAEISHLPGLTSPWANQPHLSIKTSHHFMYESPHSHTHIHTHTHTHTHTLTHSLKTAVTLLQNVVLSRTFSNVH